MVWILICLIIGVYNYISHRKRMRNRYVRKNEVEKTEFLTEMFTCLINTEEEHFLSGKKRKVIITGLIVNHPMDKNKPWTVIKQIKFTTNGWYDLGYMFPKTIDNKTINFYSISDEELEDLEDYKIKYPTSYISPHTKNLIKSVNTEDSFTYDLEYIDKHENVKVKQSQSLTCDKCKNEQKNGNFCRKCGNKLVYNEPDIEQFKLNSSITNQQNEKWKTFFLYALIFLFFVVLPISLYDNTGNNVITSTKKTTTTTKKKPDAEKYFSRKVYWADNYGGNRSKILKIKESAYWSSISNRKDIMYSTWRTMANSVIRNDKNKLTEVFKMFDNIYKSENMSRSYFADVIVSFAQDIPYSLIDNSLDIYAPVEFLKKYKGDCDTRTIFLYTILKKYNYDVIILNSGVYSHSIIGINLPTSGNNYKYYNGKRYYSWETTNTGWKRGLLNPSQKNMNNWIVALK